jgi:hypothetical protein
MSRSPSSAWLPPPILLANPIPLALHSYADVLKATLEESGHTVLLVEGEGTERVAEPALLRRVRNAVRYYRRCAQVARGTTLSDVIVCWPLFGYLEFLVWAVLARTIRNSRPRMRIVVHDLVPPGGFTELRSWGYLPTGAVLETLARRTVRRVGAVVHTESARELLGERGWRKVEFLPHPIGKGPVVPSTTERHALTVAGRCKPIRQLELLSELGGRPRTDDLEFLVLGTGWPDIPGWRRWDGFIPEEAFQRALAESRAVLIPSVEYSQSGVAVQAFEKGTPVIGIRHAQLEQLYGTDYPGMVDELTADAVTAACQRVAAHSRDHWLGVATSYRSRTRQRWADALKPELGTPVRSATREAG